MVQADFVTPVLSRRTLLKGTAAAIAVSIGGLRSVAAQESGPADKIWTGGTILTMNDTAMRVEAVAEKAGRIISAGTLAKVLALKGPNTVMVDLGGRTMLPGFVDAHGHATIGGLQAISANLLSPPDGEVVDIPSLQQTLRDWIAANEGVIEKAGLIIGFGYDQSQLAELRAPTKQELDAVSTDIPVLLVHQSAHMGALNSKALALAGISADTEDPPGGLIQRAPGTREPSGVVEENAFAMTLPTLFRNVGPESLAALAEAGAKMWASYGYTTVQEGKSSQAIDAVWQKLAGEGRIDVDVVSYPDYLSGRDYAAGAASRDYVNGFRVGGTKLTIDGSPQGFTAWRDRPYYAPVGNFPPAYVGYPAVKTVTVVEALEWAFARNVQILVHSNGEAASDALIAAVRAATEANGPGDRRTVLIHGQFLREDQVQSFVDLSVFPSLFPMHTFYWGDWHRDHTVGPALADNISPTGWFRDRGAMFSTHHDAPVAFPDSMRILDATVTRRSRSGDIVGPAQRVDVLTALKAMTLWPAYQHFEDNSKGSIEVGKRADFVILSADPTTVDPETLDTIIVTETVKDGETIYVRGTKKAELLQQRDLVNTAMAEMFRQLHLTRELQSLAADERSDDARAQILAAYEDCDASLLLPWLFGVEEGPRSSMRLSLG